MMVEEALRKIPTLPQRKRHGTQTPSLPKRIENGIQTKPASMTSATQTAQPPPPQAQSLAYLMLAGLLTGFKIPPELRVPDPDRLLEECDFDLYRFHDALFQRSWEHLMAQSLSANHPLPPEHLACISNLAKVIERQFYKTEKPSDPHRFLVESPAFTAQLLSNRPRSSPADLVREWEKLTLARRVHPS